MDTALEERVEVYRSLQELESRRGLKPHFFTKEDPVGTRATFEWVLTRFDEYIKTKYPGHHTYTFIKAYQEVPHGQKASYVLSIAYPGSPYFQHALPDLIFWATFKTLAPWTGGLSGVILINHSLSEEVLRKDAWEELDAIMLLPLADMDEIYTRRDLERVVSILADNGFSGVVSRSGDKRKPGYHYVADFVMPYEPWCWKVMGKLMKILTPDNENLNYLPQFAQRLMNAESIEQAKVVGKEILDTILSGTRVDSWFDPRWGAHGLEIDNPFHFLRTEPVTRHLTESRIVADIY